MHRRWLRPLLASSAILCTLLTAELLYRAALQSDHPALVRLQQPGQYADFLSDDDYWLLYFAWDRTYEPPGQPHPELGWVHRFDRQTLRHTDAESVGEQQRPVLLYGDSYAACVEGVDCFEDILGADPAFSAHNVLLNYGVGGYGSDQNKLLLEGSLSHHEAPFVVISLMPQASSCPMTRCSARTWPLRGMHGPGSKGALPRSRRICGGRWRSPASTLHGSEEPSVERPQRSDRRLP